MRNAPAGLCDSCRHQRVVGNTRGSEFSLCERSRTDPSYPKYPRLPVLRCAGYEPRTGAAQLRGNPSTMWGGRGSGLGGA